MLTQHLVNSCGKLEKTAGPSGRSGRVIMTNEARVLRELRIQSGLSMRKAGALLGYTDSYISHIENGRSDIPKGDRLDKFLEVYGGIKQKSFYERVRRFSESVDPRQELIEMIQNLPADKVTLLCKLATSI